MTQPSFVPITEADQVRPALRLEVPGAWEPDRPAELRVPRATPGRGMGTPGPDQGYALGLARRFADRLVLGPGEHDRGRPGGRRPPRVPAGRPVRAGAPSVYDVTAALGVFGFLGQAPSRSRRGRAAAVRLGLPRLRPPARPRRRRPRGDVAPRTPPEIEARSAPGDWRIACGLRRSARQAPGSAPEPGLGAAGWTSSASRSTPTGSRSRPGPRGHRPGVQSCSSTGSPSPRGPGATSSPGSPRPATAGVAPDQRGYSPGARPTAVADYAVPHLVADVLAIADTMDMATFDLVGHDWGGMVAWVTAARHPDRLRSLTVVSTPHPEALRAALAGRDPGPSRAVRVHLAVPTTRRSRTPAVGRGRERVGAAQAVRLGRSRRRRGRRVRGGPDPARRDHGRPQLVPGHGRRRRGRLGADRGADPLSSGRPRTSRSGGWPPRRPTSTWPAATASTS